MSKLPPDDPENSPEEGPPEPYNTWDEYFADFDRKLEDASPITIRERIGNPTIRSIDEIPASELEGELDALIELLYTNNIVVEFIHEIGNREAFVFITEELLNETLDDIHIPDVYSHFIYEEFHPNDEDEVELWTGEFLDAFFKEGTEDFFLPISDKELYDVDGNGISPEEFKKQIDEFHALHSVITEYEYDIIGLNIDGNYAVVEVAISWAGLNKQEQAMLRHHGTSMLRLRRNSDIGWDVIQAKITGWNH